MITTQQRTEARFAAIPDVWQQLGVFVGMVGALAQVLVGDAANPTAITIPAVGQYPPWPGDSVQLERRNGRLTMTGPAVQKSPTGVIAVAGTPRASVTSDGRLYEDMPVRSGYVPAVGDKVTINWVAQVIEGKVDVLDQGVTPEVPAGTTKTPFEHVFRAIDSGQFRTRWQSNTVQASDSVSGAWFYGDAINGTLADAADIFSIEIYLPLLEELGVCQVGYHGYPTIPGGWTGSTGEVPLAPRTGWVALPTSFADFLKANTGGITVTSGNGMNRWAGTQADGLSGALRIRGTA